MVRENDEETDRSLRGWERRAIVALLGLLSAVFGVWAMAVWDGSQDLVHEVRAVRTEMVADRIEQREYRTLMERRITTIEQRQAWVIEALRTDGHAHRVPAP